MTTPQRHGSRGSSVAGRGSRVAQSTLDHVSGINPCRSMVSENRASLATDLAQVIERRDDKKYLPVLPRPQRPGVLTHLGGSAQPLGQAARAGKTVAAGRSALAATACSPTPPGVTPPKSPSHDPFATFLGAMPAGGRPDLPPPPITTKRTSLTREIAARVRTDISVGTLLAQNDVCLSRGTARCLSSAWRSRTSGS
jgi:hypothetical protein